MQTGNKFTLKDVRCFDGLKEFSIRPLTLLVGENSTGKSTMLGCFQSLADFINSDGLRGIDFNNAPYQMGAFADIVRTKDSQLPAFELGFKNDAIKYVLTLVGREDGSEPIIQQLRMEFDYDGEIIVFIKDTPSDQAVLFEEKGSNKFAVSISSEHARYFRRLANPIDIFLYLNRIKTKQEKETQAKKRFVLYLSELVHQHKRYSEFPWNFLDELATYSLSPIRSKPERTYNPLKETQSPDGKEMPMVLMNLFTHKNEDWVVLKKQLEDFGNSSGLFTDIEVRKLGGSIGDPFQLQVKVRGPKVNLVDVGYGVSQILPILVRILTTQHARFLLQQPEVHLHPRGQAEFATFLAKSVAKKKHSFLLETHSDYIIDRVRISVRDKIIKPEDVSILYFEPEQNDGAVAIHNIEVDDQGNLVHVPKNYRDFFMRETNKLLGFS